MTKEKSNIYIFFGEDDFSLQRKIDHWKTEFAKKFGVSAIVALNGFDMSETEIIENIKQHLAPSLFASKKLIIIRDGLPNKASQIALGDFLLQMAPLVPNDIFIIFWQSQKPDGRLSFIKKFKALAKVEEFNLPQGRMLDAWIKAMAKTMGSEISIEAVDRLAVFLGRDLWEEKKPAPFDLWQAYSELQKLSSNTTKVEVEHVEKLVKPKISDSVFNLTDQILARNQTGAFQALENFLSTQTADEKASLIKILGLISDQMRSLLVVALLKRQGMNAQQISEKLGWSEGRVFVMSKNLTGVSPGKLKGLLADLLVIDLRVKSSDTNSKLDLDLFLTKATS